MSNFHLNKTFLGGRLTTAPELKTTPTGLAVCSFKIAVNRKGAKDQTADFFNCIAWKEKAEFISKFFGKGSAICVIGTLQTRTYTDKDGIKRNVTEITVDEVYFVDSKAENVSAPGQAQAPAEANFVALGEMDDIPF